MLRVLIVALVVVAAAALGPPFSTVKVQFFDLNDEPIDRSLFALRIRVSPTKKSALANVAAAANNAASNAFFAAGSGEEVTFRLIAGQRYELSFTVTDSTSGKEIRGSHFITAPPRTKQRRREDFTFPIFVPTYLSGPDHYQLVSVWRKEAGNARCDFDSILKYPHVSTCPGCVVDAKDNGCAWSNGYCYEYTWTWPWPSASLQNDDACGGTQLPSGKEVIDIIEPGTGNYKHLIYANKNEGDFTGSLAQAHLYRKTTSGDIEEIAASYVEDIGTFNGDHRFFHTLDFTLNTPAGTYTASNVESVTCNPSATTGSTSVLAIEKKYSSGGLARNC